MSWGFFCSMTLDDQWLNPVTFRPQPPADVVHLGWTSNSGTSGETLKKHGLARRSRTHKPTLNMSQYHSVSAAVYMLEVREKEYITTTMATTKTAERGFISAPSSMEHGDSGQHHTSEEHPGDGGPWKVHDDQNHRKTIGKWWFTGI